MRKSARAISRILPRWIALPLAAVLICAGAGFAYARQQSAQQQDPQKQQQDQQQNQQTRQQQPNADELRNPSTAYRDVTSLTAPTTLSEENMARVTVHTFPKGAQIMFNSRMMDRASPAEFLLGPGTYEVTLTLTGYKPVHKMITVESNGRMEVNETMER